MRVLHIVPQVPPAICGVGDFSWHIARGLRENFGVNSTFLVAGHRAVEAHSNSEFRVLKSSGTAESLLCCLKQEAIKTDAVILHVSGYGYAKRGAPISLAIALSKFSLSTFHLPVLSMFHELFAGGPPNSSSFWLQPLQKWALKRIVESSTGLRTSRKAYAKWLSLVGNRRLESIPAYPIFSNLGESPIFIPYEQRESDSVVLFQPPGLEDKKFWTALAEIRLRSERKKLTIGGRVKSVPEGMNDDRRGYMSASAASVLLNDTSLGLLTYYDGYLAKSSLLASFAAHGVATVMPQANHSEADGLLRGIHYLTPDQIGLVEIEPVGRRLYEWYQGHNLESTIASIAMQLNEIVSNKKA